MMTSARFQYLKRNPDFTSPEEKKAFDETILWEKRSASAKKAVITKRRKYKEWPTRKGDHR